MKIIHLILGKARQERMNGVSKVAHELASTQARMGYEVEMWGLTGTPDEQLPPRAYELRLFMQKNQFSLDASIKKAILELKGQQVCFHIHGGFILPFYRIARRLHRLQIPYVFTPHGSYSPFAFQRSGWKKKAYFYGLEAGMVRRAKALQFSGESGYQSFDELLKIDHKVLIPNGQNMEDLILEEEKVLDHKDPIFSFCGRLINHYKGLDILMEAFGRYVQGGGKGQLWLIGDGPDKESLQAQASTFGVSDQVIFWGSKYGNEKLSLLQESDAFVHPSRSEGFPTAVLEAAGLGLPCMVSKATNVAGYIKQFNAGIGLPKNDVMHIVEALFYLEMRKEMGTIEEMGNAARQMVKDEFSWENITSRLLKVYGLTTPIEA